MDSGIYLIKNGQPFDEPGQMLLIKNDPKYNEQWPRALVPYKRIYGIDAPPVLAPIANDGKSAFVDGAWVDDVIMSILEHEYRALAPIWFRTDG